MKLLVSTLLLCLLSCAGQSTFTDSQGNTYETVRIGEQTWMAENLNFAVANGSYCYLDDPSNCEKMGRLYTWQAAKEAAEAIDGWHLPSKNDWNELLVVCGDDSAGFKNITSAELGFNPVWAGVRVSYGEFKTGGMGANFWSSTPSDTNAGLGFSVAVMNTQRIISVHNYPQDNACSVRLLRD